MVQHSSPMKRRDTGEFAVINFSTAQNDAGAKVALSKARRRGNDLLKLALLFEMRYGWLHNLWD